MTHPTYIFHTWYNANMILSKFLNCIFILMLLFLSHQISTIAFEAPPLDHQPPTRLRGDETGAKTTAKGGSTTITQTKTDGPHPNKDGSRRVKTTTTKTRTTNKDGSSKDETVTKRELKKLGGKLPAAPSTAIKDVV